MSFPRYELYKDSGVEWLGQIPEHWNFLAGRRLFREVFDSSWPTDEQLSATQKYGVIPQKLFMEREEQKVVLALRGLEAFKHVEVDDFIISLRSFQGGIEKSHYQGCVSTAYTVLRSLREIAPSYWMYLFKSEAFISVLRSVTDGIREGKSISYAQFAQISLPIPPTSEQEQIAALLEQEAAKIDELIEEQRRLIALLKENRQAAISHAVTKGLNPAAPMKDSGIEWIGEIPEHWEVGPIKRWFDTSSGGTPDTSRYDEFYSRDGVPWIRTTDLNNDELSRWEIAISNEAIATTACSLLRPGSVLVAMYGGGGTIGKNALLMIQACINQAVCALGPNEAFDEKYTFRYIQYYRPYWMIKAESSRIDPNISQDLIRNAPILRPPLHEQTAIARFLTEETETLSVLEQACERQTSLLQERRSALISAAVTGKIDIRNYSPRETPSHEEVYEPA